MPSQFECPSCGANVRIRKGNDQVECTFCGSTVHVPREYRSIKIPVTATGTGKSCAATAIVVAAAVLVGVAGLVVFLLSSEGRGTEVAGFISGRGADQVLQFGGEGISPGRFEDPRAIAVDADGNIYVGEYDSGRVQVFDDDGEFITQWTIQDENVYISDMDCTRDGSLYIIYRNRLRIYDGMTGEETGSLEHPDGDYPENVAIAPDGSIIVAWNTISDDIYRFDPNGKVDLVIPEAISSRIGETELDMHVAVDARGNIYALGTFNNVVVSYDREGVYQNRFGSDGDLPGSFVAPGGIAADALGRILVSDVDGVMVFDPGGTYAGTIPVDGWVFGMYVDDDNRLYTVTSNSMVYVFDLDELELN